MTTATESPASQAKTQRPQKPWEAEPRLWSLWDMLKIHADHFVEATRELTSARHTAEAIAQRSPPHLQRTRHLVRDLDPGLTETLEQLRNECETLQLRLTVKHINRFLSSTVDLPELSGFVEEIYWRFRDELTGKAIYCLEGGRETFYEAPLSGWTEVIERFGCGFDVEEARKCVALERYTAAVFHLMKVVEAAVLELQVFLKAPDVKAHFGSVLSKLTDITQKTKYEHIPPNVQPYVQFMKDILVQLYAVKNSWRDKVSHVDERLVPIDTFTEELAKGVHDATLLLMKKLMAGLPPKPTA